MERLKLESFSFEEHYCHANVIDMMSSYSGWLLEQYFVGSRVLWVVTRTLLWFLDDPEPTPKPTPNPCSADIR